MSLVDLPDRIEQDDVPGVLLKIGAAINEIDRKNDLAHAQVWKELGGIKKTLSGEGEDGGLVAKVRAIEERVRGHGWVLGLLVTMIVGTALAIWQGAGVMA